MSYKSSAFRNQTPSVPVDVKYRTQVQQLQECFPNYSVEDLQSLLTEVTGDVETAAARLSEGHVEQWGSVKSKKDKKTPTTNLAHSKDQSVTRDRSDSRGGRGGRGGGRGGRGGVTRGAPAGRGRGATRGGLGVNGHTTRSSHPGSPAHDSADKPTVVDDLTDAPTADNAELSHGAAITGHEPSTSASNQSSEPGTSDSTLFAQSNPTSPPWGASHWSAQDHTMSSNAGLKHSISATPKVTKVPAVSGLSWAQIARPHEKPTVAPTLAVAPPVAPAPSAPESVEPAPAPLLNGDSEPVSEGWEEPTTVQPPTWDDEPQVKPPPEDAWISPVLTQPDIQDDLQDDLPSPVLQEEFVSEIPVPPPSEPVQPQPPVEEPVVAPTPSKSPVSILTRSSVASHRGAGRFKATDQAVVMPTSSFTPGLDKVGMQFGSLSLGGDVIEPSPTEPTAAAEPAPAKPQQSPQQLIQPLPSQALPQETSPTTSPAQSIATVSSQFAPQQQVSAPPPLPAPAPAPAPAPHPHPPLTSSISHPSIPTSVSQPVMTTSPAFSQQQQQAVIHPSPLSQHQPQAPLTQHQVASHHQYSHLGLPTHLDATAQHSPQHAPQPSQPQATAAHSAYFRQAEAPYFHTPTPPAGQAQDYNVFGQIGQQHPSQASHLGGFGNNDYGYGDTQRGFYESYAQSPGFGGSRNVLGHDDVKGLPASQQLPGNAVLPPSNTQSSQLPQGGAQPQPSASQGPQQSYPPPVPYYYPYPQNQYYGTPYNSGYAVPQPFVKYPTMFQPGPPAQGAAPSPAAKQGPGSAQAQSDHYGRGLYGQQHQHPTSAYDDLGYQHHAQQHTAGVNNLTSNEYSKHPQLYGGQGIQSFMGLGQGSATASGPSLTQRAGGASPETAYKPYSQNVGVKDGGAGVGVGQGAGQPQTGRGVQQAHNQGGFYGGNRFGSSAATAGPQAQQGQQQTQGPQGHAGYPQGNSDANFYQYQQRQQQGYWQ
ncbi:hypothetical protein PAXINDRAFT_167463 [Paxillus involutus ATCC 200175]|nr:hypothetical protein PAXINDRAFT_167463 [Paxillus involutus ATCC 200175]